MIRFYTIDCPRCKVLERKLDEKNIDYEKITSFNKYEFAKNGYHMMPILEVDGKFYEYSEAIKYINGKV